MGIFREDTAEEKRYKNLIKIINASTCFDQYDKNELLKRIENAKSGNYGIFLEYNFFVDVIEKMVIEEIDWISSIDDHLGPVITYMMPNGVATPSYEKAKGLIISQLIKNDGLLEDCSFDKGFYSLFDNDIDFIQIWNLINEECSYEEDIVYNYACQVSPYCPNQAIFKNELISFINGLRQEVEDVDVYFKDKLMEAKKRVGIYPLDEKGLALISSEVERAQGAIVKLEAMQKRVDSYEERVKTLTTNGKKDILAAKNESLKSLKNEVALQAKAIQDQLQSYLIELEAQLKANSDQVFGEILLDAQRKIGEVQAAARRLSQTTTQDLLRITQTTESSVEKLRQYVENEPQLRQLISEVDSSEQIREALLKFSQYQTSLDTQATIATKKQEIIIPGYDRVVVPASPNIQIPSEGFDTTILPAFNEDIPFEQRMEAIMAEKRRREAEGEFFHSLTDEIIPCVIEGDWVYLWGPSGCGKSYVIDQVASLVGLDVCENGKVTDKYSVMAYTDPHGRFRATQAFVALTYGKMLSLDELDNGNPDTHVVLNELYSALLGTLEHPNKPKYVTFAEDMTVPVNPNFRMISAGNTSGEELVNELYTARGKMDESVNERLTPKEFFYDNRIEEKILGKYEGWYDLFIKFRMACDAYAKSEGLSVASGIGTTRDAAAIAKYVRHNSKSVDQVLMEKFVQTKPVDYLSFLVRKMKEYYGFDRVTDVNVEARLDAADAKVLARRFAYKCNQTIERKKR